MTLGSWPESKSRVRHSTNWTIQASQFLFLLSLFIYFERDRERAGAGGEQRGRERENPMQAPHCQHRAWLRVWSHEQWDHDLSLNWESDTQPTEPPRCSWSCFTQQMEHTFTTKIWLCHSPASKIILTICVKYCQTDWWVKRGTYLLVVIG